MKLATLAIHAGERLCVGSSRGYIPLLELNRRLDRRWPGELIALLESEAYDEILNWYGNGGRQLLDADLELPVITPPCAFAPLYRRPQKIWGIGLNYREHAADLAERPPEKIPVGFMKPATTIIGTGDAIEIPAQSNRTTAEAELGLILKRKCRRVSRDQWRSVLAGFTTVIDVTAEDILRQNPRYLTLSKSFDTFFSFGPELLSPDEIENVHDLEVATVINGHVHRSNRVANMTFPPDFLIAYLSEVMTLLPGDIISTGTPGAVVLKGGDVVECRIDGFTGLKNSVVDLKKV